jgi:hypothetical protein
VEYCDEGEDSSRNMKNTPRNARWDGCRRRTDGLRACFDK